MNPEDPWLLNNMAWLLLTAKDKKLRDPSRGLELALKAAKLNISPQVLDTVAEGFWQTGRLESACKTSQKALVLAQKLGSKDLSYYQRRKQKFCEKERRNGLHSETSWKRRAECVSF